MDKSVGKWDGVGWKDIIKNIKGYWSEELDDYDKERWIIGQ